MYYTYDHFNQIKAFVYFRLNLSSKKEKTISHRNQCSLFTLSNHTELPSLNTFVSETGDKPKQFFFIIGIRPNQQRRYIYL